MEEFLRFILWISALVFMASAYAIIWFMNREEPQWIQRHRHIIAVTCVLSFLWVIFAKLLIDLMR